MGWPRCTSLVTCDRKRRVLCRHRTKRRPERSAFICKDLLHFQQAGGRSKRRSTMGWASRATYSMYSTGCLFGVPPHKRLYLSV